MVRILSVLFVPAEGREFLSSGRAAINKHSCALGAAAVWHSAAVLLCSCCKHAFR
jgi:hypothetical protein